MPTADFNVGGRYHQQNPDGRTDNRVHPGTVNGAEVSEQADAEDRAWDAARGKSEQDSTFYSAGADMHKAGRDFRAEIEEGVGSYGQHGRNFKGKNQQGQQENAAPDPGHADQGANYKSNQDFGCQ
jgi:hypothetical protein